MAPASMVSDPALQRVAERLDERFGLDALWLFGSESRGSATATSDVDLAALFRRRPSVAELVEAGEELSAMVSRPVDLIDLDRASPILVMQVLRHGTLLLEKNPARRLGLVAAAPGRYEELRIVRREGERRLLGRVRRGRS